jgi:hypothetical protein
VIWFWPFFASFSESGLMFSNPMSTRLTPALAAFSMKPRILWHMVIAVVGRLDQKQVEQHVPLTT